MAGSTNCGRLRYEQWCAECGPAYGNKFSGYHYDEMAFTYVFDAYRARMDARNDTSRSMSFSHETSAARHVT